MWSETLGCFHSMALLHNQSHTKESSDLCKSIGNSDFMYFDHGNYIQHCLVFKHVTHTEASHQFCHAEVWGVWLFRRVAYIPNKRVWFFLHHINMRAIKTVHHWESSSCACSENELTFTFPLLTSPASRKRLPIFWLLDLSFWICIYIQIKSFLMFIF